MPDTHSNLSAADKARLSSRLYRSRSNTDSDLPVTHTHTDDTMDHWRPRFYDLFEAIEREFSALHAENHALRRKVEVLTERLAEGGIAPPPELSPLPECAPSSTRPPPTKSHSLQADPGGPKKGSQVGQRLKTALRVPQGRLVSSLKAGVGVVGGGDQSRVRFIRSLQGHRDGVWHVATLSLPGDKGFVASASADQTARVWNAESGACVCQYTGHAGSVNSVAVSGVGASAEGFLVLTGSGDESAHIWRAAVDKSPQVVPHGSSEEEVEGGGSEEENDEDAPPTIRTPLLQLTGHTGVVVCADWLPCGKKVITASWDRTANLYDAERGEVLNILSGHDQELTVCAASSGPVIATASRDTTFRLWDFREAIGSVAVFQGHSDSVNAVAFASDHRLVSGSDDRCVKVWDLRNMRAPEASVRLDSPVNRVSVSDRGLIAIPHDNRAVRLYTLSGLRVARLPRPHSHRRMVTATAWLHNQLFTAAFDSHVLHWLYTPTAKD